MTIPDLKNLTAAQLRELLHDADTELKVRLKEDVNKIVDDLFSRAKECDIDLKDILTEVRRRQMLPTAPEQATIKVSKKRHWKKGVTYCHPTDGSKTWTFSGVGVSPKWLRELVPAGLDEDNEIKFIAELEKH